MKKKKEIKKKGKGRKGEEREEEGKRLFLSMIEKKVYYKYVVEHSRSLDTRESRVNLSRLSWVMWGGGWEGRWEEPDAASSRSKVQKGG